jgi:hypothetical protein
MTNCLELERKLTEQEGKHSTSFDSMLVELETVRAPPAGPLAATTRPSHSRATPEPLPSHSRPRRRGPPAAAAPSCSAALCAGLARAPSPRSAPSPRQARSKLRGERETRARLLAPPARLCSPALPTLHHLPRHRLVVCSRGQVEVDAMKEGPKQDAAEVATLKEEMARREQARPRLVPGGRGRLAGCCCSRPGRPAVPLVCSLAAQPARPRRRRRCSRRWATRRSARRRRCAS